MLQDADERDAIELRRLRHDIQHALATLAMLAEAVVVDPELSESTRFRIGLIAEEARSVSSMLRDATDLADRPPPGPLRVDEVVADAARAIRLSTVTSVEVIGAQTWAAVDLFGLWRAVRNVLDNAVRAAGSGGLVVARVQDRDGDVLVEIDDSGPGFDSAPGGSASLGLGIVQDFVASSGGSLEISRSSYGGGRVTMLLPGYHGPASSSEPSAGQEGGQDHERAAL